MPTMIETKALEFAYPAEEGEKPVLALRGVDTAIEKGSFVVVLGHNGSGKSTFAKSLNAILLPCGGKVYVEGMDTQDEACLLEIRRRVGMVFQNPDNQIVANVVEEDVAFAPENLGVASEEIRRRVDDALAAVDMTAFMTHAPHLLSEKEGGALKAMSGMPMIQFSLVSMLQLVDEGVFTLETIVEKMCHAPAQIYRINERGYIREGYRADLVLVRPDTPWEVTADKVLSKCGWSPLEGHTFNWKVERTFANGHPVYSDGMVDDAYRGEELRFGE